MNRKAIFQVLFFSFFFVAILLSFPSFLAIDIAEPEFSEDGARRYLVVCPDPEKTREAMMIPREMQHPQDVLFSLEGLSQG